MKLGALIKWGILIKGVGFAKAAEEVCSETFLQRIREAESFHKNLMKSPNLNKNVNRQQRIPRIIYIVSRFVDTY
jgi:hypothetical protein